MVIKGCFSEIEKRLNWYLKLFEESVLLNSDFLLNMTITSNGRNVILVDKNSLEEIKSLVTEEKVIGKNAFVMDEEIYHLFHSQDKRTIYMTDSTETHPISYKTKTEHKTDKEKDKSETKIAKASDIDDYQKDDIHNVQQENYSARINTNMSISLTPDYRIQDHLEESVRLSKPCVFGIKYIDDNLFTLFYRNSVYDKGSDTTFRHYLCQQPGTLVSYMYIKELSSLKYQFEQFGRKLRHNGQNILSRVQSDQLVHHFTWCWI